MARGGTSGSASTWLMRLGAALAGLVIAIMSVLALAARSRAGQHRF